MKFYYVYVLHNKTKEFVYVGYSENIRGRVAEHNKGKVKSTKRYKPLKLVHYEAYTNMKDAKRREFYFKTTKGRTTLRYMLKEHLAT